MMEPKDLAAKVAEILDDKKALDVVLIDISGKAAFADYFVLASTNSERQMGALVDNVEDALEPEGIFPKSVEGKKASGWILMDYGDIIVNIMTMEMRDKYSIEKIWGDCYIQRIN